MKTVFTLLAFFLIQNLSGQILNIERLRIVTDTTGWSGTIGVALSASKYKQSFFSTQTNGHLQYNDGKNLFLTFGGITFVSAGGQEFNNSGFGHFRYNRKLNELVRLEAFTQVQYNSLTKIESRILNGIGIRLKLSPYEKAKFYYGLTYMYEYEKLNDPELTNKDNRASSYFSFTLAPESNIKFTNTTYIQPKLGEFRDYRLSNDTAMVFGINKHLEMKTNFHYLYDSKPPIGIPKINYEVSNGLSFSF